MQNGVPRILVISKPAIGDALLATPLLHSIRQSEPHALIDLLVYDGQESIVEGNPDVDNVLTLPMHPSARQLAAALKSMWRRYDIGIGNAVDDRCHLYLWAFARKRVAVHIASTAAWKRWITHAAFFEDSQGTHTLLRNNGLGKLLSFPANYDVIPPAREPGAACSPVLTKIQAGGEQYAVLHLEARLPYKRWTVDGWCEVADFLVEQGIRVFLSGGGGEEEDRYLETVMLKMPAAVTSLSGKLRFAETSELIAGCRVYVGIDTVNSHIAAAHGVPTVVLFGPESPYRWGPWPAGYVSETSPWQSAGTQRRGNVTIVQSDVGCDTCRQGDCRKRHNRGTDCPLMTGITSRQVIAALEEVLST
jgi:heptosyltransferase-3